jgi:DNA-binding response OmpR family regulator
MSVQMDRILLIHPEGKAADELAFVLQHSGFQVVRASEGALAQMEGNRPDLIVMAESNHTVNGDELCIRIREISNVPIIILGRGKQEIDGVDFLEMGADVYLTSPLNARELLARVRSLLRRSKGNFNEYERWRLTQDADAR